MSNQNIMGLGPMSLEPAHIISASGNIEAALFMIINYLQSTYDLQAADTQMEESITNAETQAVTNFENGLTASNPAPGTYLPGFTDYIFELENLNPKEDPNYSSDVSILTELYTNANAKNQAQVKVMDGNNSTAQNVLSQNAQGQQGLMQTMGSINGLEANLSRIIQG